jgi:hypothetical protein
MKSLFALGVILRLALCWVNPPYNSFDNHFEPIALIVNTETIPPKDACFECYHPPIFYVIGAAVAKILDGLGVTEGQIFKTLQFVNCLYGILTLWILFLILYKIPLPDFSRLLAYGTICFLPRHIYMSAMHGNDTITYVAVALSTYLLLLVLERRLALLPLLLLSITLAVTLFTKYTAFVVLPMVVTTFVVSWYCRLVTPRRWALIAMFVVLVLPLTLLGGYMYSNTRHYGSPLPVNDKVNDIAANQPRDAGGMSFVSFKPWEFMREPILVPGQLSSFATLLYSGMWFDTEPKFIMYIDKKFDWWKRYYAWLRGDTPFPPDKIPIDGVTRLLATALLTLGLVPLVLIMYGFVLFFFNKVHDGYDSACERTVRLQIFAVLLLANLSGIILLTLWTPVYSWVKPSYLLNSIPAFGVFLAVGSAALERTRGAKLLLGGVFGIIFILVTLHVLQLTAAFSFKLGEQ